MVVGVGVRIWHCDRTERSAVIFIPSRPRPNLNLLEFAVDKGLRVKSREADRYGGDDEDNE